MDACNYWQHRLVVVCASVTRATLAKYQYLRVCLCMSEYKCLCAHKCMLCESVLYSGLSMLCSVERIRGLTTKPKQEDIGAENYQHRKRKQAKMRPKTHTENGENKSKGK